VAGYARDHGIDPKPLQEFLENWAAAARQAVFGLLRDISEQISNDPDTPVCNALQIALCSVEQLRTLAPRVTDSNANEGWKQEQALDSYRQLQAQLGTMAKTPRRDEWAHLEAWKCLGGISRMLQRIAGERDTWTTICIRLRQEIPGAPAPEFEHLRAEARENLARLRGESEACPRVVPLSPSTPPDPGLGPRPAADGGDLDTLLGALDRLTALVAEHNGNRPHADFLELLALDQEVAALCSVTGLTLPPITYAGVNYDLVGFCRIPVTRHTGGATSSRITVGNWPWGACGGRLN
jgi:hypothetical protein